MSGNTPHNEPDSSSDDEDKLGEKLHGVIQRENATFQESERQRNRDAAIRQRKLEQQAWESAHRSEPAQPQGHQHKHREQRKPLPPRLKGIPASFVQSSEVIEAEEEGGKAELRVSFAPGAHQKEEAEAAEKERKLLEYKQRVPQLPKLPALERQRAAASSSRALVPVEGPDIAALPPPFVNGGNRTEYQNDAPIAKALPATASATADTSRFYDDPAFYSYCKHQAAVLPIATSAAQHFEVFALGEPLTRSDWDSFVARERRKAPRSPPAASWQRDRSVSPDDVPRDRRRRGSSDSLQSSERDSARERSSRRYRSPIRRNRDRNGHRYDHRGRDRYSDRNRYSEERGPKYGADRSYDEDDDYRGRR